MSLSKPEGKLSDQQLKASNRPLRILYGISSVGLGHVRRSIAVAERLRSIQPFAQIDFVAAEPALSFLKKAGEKNILEVSSNLQSMSEFLEKESKDGKISDMSKITAASVEGASANYDLIKPFLPNYDILIQDEFVETMFSFMWDKNYSVPNLKTVVITDYVQFDTESSNPFNKIKISYANRMLRKAYLNQQLRIFADSPDALPPKGDLLEFVSANFHVVGPVVENLPKESADELRKRFFGETEGVTFLIFSVGGTSIGKRLVEFVVRNADILSERLDAYLVVLAGPRVDISKFKENTSTRLSVVPFTLDSVKYFKAAHCVVTQAGVSTMNEVASIGTPCVVIPIGHHFEQMQNAERFANKFNFQILEYNELGRTALERAVRDALANKYDPMPPSNAAESIAKLVFSFASYERPEPSTLEAE